MIRTIIMALCLCTVYALSTSFVAQSAAQEKMIIQTAWLSEYEAFPAWYAKEQGLDIQAGFILETKHYPTGKTLVDSFNSNAWNIGAAGFVPVIDAVDKNDAQIIALGADETSVNKIIARADNSIFTVKGTNPHFPEIYGSAEIVRGKTVLCALNTNAHELLLAWLQALGLKESDVRIVDTQPEDALQAFADGMGDFVVLWAPNMYEAESKGFTSVATAEQCHIFFGTVLFTKKDFLTENPQAVQNFITMYLNAVARIEALPAEEQALLYQQLQKKYADNTIDLKTAQQTLRDQELFNEAAQIQAFENSESSFYKTLKSAIKFYSYINAIPRKAGDYLDQMTYIHPIKGK